MEEEKAKQMAIQAERAKQPQLRPRGRYTKRKKGEHGEAVAVEDSGKTKEEEPPVFLQPSLITGAKLKSYQLEGLQWMVSLDQNGISGILGMSHLRQDETSTNFIIYTADEMGLGKVGHFLWCIIISTSQSNILSDTTDHCLQCLPSRAP